jgi:hypothetical protein
MTARWGRRGLAAPAGGAAGVRLRRGAARVRSCCRFASPLIHVIPDSLSDSVPLFLNGRCGRILGAAHGRRCARRRVRGHGERDRTVEGHARACCIVLLSVPPSSIKDRANERPAVHAESEALVSALGHRPRSGPARCEYFLAKIAFVFKTGE